MRQRETIELVPNAVGGLQTPYFNIPKGSGVSIAVRDIPQGLGVSVVYADFALVEDSTCGAVSFQSINLGLVKVRGNSITLTRDNNFVHIDWINDINLKLVLHSLDNDAIPPVGYSSATSDEPRGIVRIDIRRDVGIATTDLVRGIK